MITISFIIPMYNVARFLNTCVNSVLDQHMDEDEFEILMVNDGSPDESKKIAEELAKKHSFIKVLSQKNKGLGGARNLGIKNAKGNYLVFLDADDILIPDAIPDLLNIAQQKNLDILEFGANQINESGEILATISKNSGDEVYSGINYYRNIKYMNSACNKLYSKYFIDFNDLLFTERIYSEDLEFNTRSYYYAERIMATSKLGASFLQSAGSITRNHNKATKDKYVNDFKIILEKIKGFKDDVLKQKDKKELISLYFEERLAMCNLGLFYFLFKNNYSYEQIQEIRQDLRAKGIYRSRHQVADKERDLFRKILLRNFYLFRLTQPIKRMLDI